MKIATVVVALLIFTVNVSSEGIKGAGATSCGSWLKERRNGTYFNHLQWVFGFISAYNQFEYRGSHSDGVFGSADWEAVAAWMDNYCDENPLSSPYAGSLELIKELQEIGK